MPLNQQQEELLRELREVREMVKRCDIALTGDPTHGVNGLVQNMDSQSSRVSALSARIFRIEIVGLVVLFTVGSQIPSVWKEIITILK